MAAVSPDNNVASANAVYLRNMETLWRHNPALAVRIDAVADAARLPVEQTKSGLWTTAITGPDGRKAYLHSRYDPETEAARLAEGIETDERYCFIVTGFGLGYHLQAIRRKAGPEAVIVVAEPNVELLATALARVDLGDVLADGRLVILTEASKAALHAALQPHMAMMMLGARFVSHPPSERTAPEFHAEMRRLIAEYVAYSRMTLVTLVANSEITCRNIAQNLVHYVSTPSIDVLKRRFAGYPAIIVSAGPSLRKNIDRLADARGRAVVCAVQTVLRSLLEHGIRPDFVTSLDYHPVSGHYFEGLEGVDDIHLVAEPKVTWHVTDNYHGPMSLLDNEFARLIVGDDLAPHDRLPPGATVAHLALYLAAYMGCDPIILVGQDLAYTGHVYYVPGVEMHRTWRSEINRFNTLETKEWERLVRSRKMLRKTVDNAGNEIYTDELLFTYLEQFEKDIAASGARVINATEGGARIRGTEVMALHGALETHAQRPIPPERFQYRRTTVWRDASRMDALRRELEARMTEIRSLESVCQEMIQLLEKLQGLTHDPDQFNRVLIRVDELRAKINEENRALKIVNTASQLAELRRFSADRRLAAGKAEGAERAKRQLRRDVEFVTATRDACRTMLGILESAVARAKSGIAESVGRHA